VFAQEVKRDNGDMADAIRYLLDVTAPLHQNLFQATNVGQDANNILAGGSIDE
jgi:hypothetical protein